MQSEYYGDKHGCEIREDLQSTLLEAKWMRSSRNDSHSREIATL